MIKKKAASRIRLPLLPDKRASFPHQQWLSWSGKEAFLVYYGGNIAAKYHKNSKAELYNQFLFCNSFLLFVRYLHGGQEDVF